MTNAQSAQSGHLIYKELEKRILILDGAMGTMIQKHELDEAAVRGTHFADSTKDLKNFSDLLCITQPKIIEDIHRDFLEAGADINLPDPDEITPLSKPTPLVPRQLLWKTSISFRWRPI